MSRYILTDKIMKTLEARKLGYQFICSKCEHINKQKAKICSKCGGEVIERNVGLICKICECPLHKKDCVESKQQRRGKMKLYHCECYDKAHIDIPNDDISDEEVEAFFKRPRLLTEEEALEWIEKYG